jgi:phycocyanobilin:ferredoxin oxidoreductase
VFPHTHNPAPIFGYDVIAGKNKITGCFHDFSPAGDKNHPLIYWFADEAANLTWKKVRKLPDWAERIFTTSMISAGNIHIAEELAQISSMARDNLKHYLSTVAETNNTVADTTQDQNYYCDNQRQNPHTPKVMTSLGLDVDEVNVFIQDCLFPKIGEN